jgi:AbrB family looped-hinge helix DNA binding protein
MLTNTGIVRKMDDLGRLVVPKELRNSLGLRAGDEMELFVDTQRKMVAYAPAKPATAINWGKMGDMACKVMTCGFRLVDAQGRVQYNTTDMNMDSTFVHIPLGADAQTYGTLEYYEETEQDTQNAMQAANILNIFLREE